MLRVLAISAILLLLFAAGAVMASETDWSIYMRATDGSHPDTTLRMGTTSGTPFSSTYQPVSNATMHAAIIGGSGLLSTDVQANIVPPETRSWQIDVWANTGSTVNGRLNFWSTSTLTPPSVINGVAYEYKIAVVQDPTGLYAAGTSWTFTPGATGTSTQPVGYINFSFMGPHYNGEHVQLMLTAESVPEPSGILALTCGLFSSFGIVLRRRIH